MKFAMKLFTSSYSRVLQTYQPFQVELCAQKSSTFLEVHLSWSVSRALRAGVSSRGPAKVRACSESATPDREWTWRPDRSGNQERGIGLRWFAAAQCIWLKILRVWVGKSSILNARVLNGSLLEPTVLFGLEPYLRCDRSVWLIDVIGRCDWSSRFFNILSSEYTTWYTML